MKGVIFLFFFFSFQLLHAQGVWTWMGGDTTSNSVAIYGIQGIPSVNNHPPALYSPFCWTDLQGNFWLFGGAADGSTTYSDLWKYNPTTLEWTWVKGNKTNNAPARYGTMGAPDPSNTPGSRSYSGCTWVDTSGNLWFYGGTAMGSGLCLADMWEYNIASNEWAWMSGFNSSNQPASYGIQGVPSPTNTPGSRGETGSPWVDANGKFWMYGGSIADGSQTRADMWMYDPVTNMWTWESGSQNTGIPAVYGTRGVFASANTPGRRWPYAMITETSGNFLLFGGGNGLTVSFGDLWEYNPSINQWAWISGTQSSNSPGVAGTVCQSDTTFYPDTRLESRAAWKDCNGNFWIYGGSTDLFTVAGDMWVYLVATKKWARMSNGINANSKPVFGVQGVPALSNTPGSRRGSSHWKDKNGNFWLSGGFNNNSDMYGTMWRYTPDSVCVNSKCNCIVSAGIISLSLDTFCAGSGEKSKLTVSGNAGEKLQWQSSPDGIHFSNLQGDTLSTYTTPPSLAQTTYYRMYVNAGCGTDSSNIDTLHIVPEPIAIFTYTIKGDTVTFNADSSSADVIAYRWDFGDQSISSEKNPFHVYNSTDTFYVCLTVYNGSNCSYTLCKYISILKTGIENISTDNFIRLYPNPANNTVNLSVEGLTGNYQLIIYNVFGQQVLDRYLNLNVLQTLPINLNGFVQGTYELILLNDGEYYSKCFVHIK